MMLWKCCTQYASKFGKLSSGHRTGKGQFSFQFQRKAMPKNVQTTTQMQLSHMLVMIKILHARVQQDMNCEIPDIQAGFWKGRETRNQIANICGIIEKARGFQKNSSVSLTALNMPATLENSAVATGLEKASFHSNSKERQCKKMLKLPHNYTHLTCS